MDFVPDEFKPKILGYPDFFARTRQTSTNKEFKNSQRPAQ